MKAFKKLSALFKSRIYREMVLSATSAIVIAVIIFMSAAVFFNGSLGWFSQNRQVSGSGMSVSPGASDFPEMHAWRFDLTATVGTGDNTDEDGDTLDKRGQWVDALDHETVTDPEGILPVENYSGNAHHELLKFKSLHLGTVDNLLTLSEDNCFYIRFDVTDELFRTYVGYSLDDSGITVYDQDRNDRTSEIAALEDEEHNSLNALDKFVELFQADVAVSANEFTPGLIYNKATGELITGEPGEGVVTATGEEMIDALFYTTETVEGNEVTTRTGLLTNGDDLRDLGEQARAYYIYIRFSPDLEKCFEATDHIATYMPCEITFDVTLTLSFE